MLYKLRKDCYIRLIGDYGYIKSIGLFNDQVFDKSGQMFIKELSKIPKSIDQLANDISKNFANTSCEEIKDDVVDFFEKLVEDGFVSKGETIEDIEKNDVGFTYKKIMNPIQIYDYTPNETRSSVSSQDLLDNYFVNNPYLSRFQIELTSKCNERCIHCYIPHEYKNALIDEKLFYSILDQLKEMGTLSVTLSGGEPLLHPKFKEFLKAAKERDFYVHVLSNLTLLDDEMIRIMREGNTCGVQVSLYSMKPNIHDAITTVKGSFEKTINSILKLIANDIPVQISCPIMNANKDELAGVYEWALEHNIKVACDYSIMAEYNHNTDNLANRITPEEAGNVIKTIIAYNEDYRNRILSNEFSENESKINTNPDEILCGVGINSCCMVSNGNVYPCPGWQGYVCGNANDNSIYDIWFNSEKMNYLRSLRKKDLKKCLSCDNKAFCHPCLGRFANESKTGNPLEIADHFCKVAAVNKNVVHEYITVNKTNKH